MADHSQLIVDALCPLCPWAAHLTAGDDVAEARTSIRTLIDDHIADLHPNSVAAYAFTVRLRRLGVTHFVPYDSPGRRRRMALCGAIVTVTDHADAPTCEDCRRLLDEREGSVGP